MTYPLIYRLITSLFVLTLAAPVSAEQLEPMLQKHRDHFNKLSEQACAGDNAARIELFDSAVNRSNPVAMNDLGWLKESQHCKFSSVDPFSARLKFQTSARAGYPIGQSNYARYLMEGKGIKRDPNLAKEYFHRAIDAGYGDAAVSLGLYYLSAEFLPIDDIKARALYDRAVKEGADSERLAKLAAALEKNDAMSNPEMSEIDERQKLFTGSWGVGYGEARWDHAPDGKFKSRVSVGVYDDSKRFYLKMMLDTDDPIIGLLGIHVEHADGTISKFDLSLCQVDTCDVSHYSDNYGYPGSFITFELPPSKQGQMLEALKSGRYVVFDYKKENGTAHNTLSLKGSRKAIEQLERANGLSSGKVGSAGASQVGDSAYEAYDAAVNTLTAELNLEWSPKTDSYQAGRQSFVATETTCLFNTFVYHPNTGKTTQEFNLRNLNPEQITWDEHFFFGKPTFFTVKTLDDRAVAKLWTDYPEGESDFKNKAEVSFYIGENGNFTGIKPHLATAIRYCNRLALQ